MVGRSEAQGAGQCHLPSTSLGKDLGLRSLLPQLVSLLCVLVPGILECSLREQQCTLAGDTLVLSAASRGSVGYLGSLQLDGQVAVVLLLKAAAPAGLRAVRLGQGAAGRLSGAVQL